MPGVKTFINLSNYELHITIYVRHGPDPHNQARDQDVDIGPGASEIVWYGNESDIYLNGFQIVGMIGGDVTFTRHIVIDRGSKLDNALNMNNTLTFSVPAGVEDVTLTPSNH